MGAATGAEPFVWTKKVEKELGEGKKVKDISIFTDQHRQAERLVRNGEHPCNAMHGGFKLQHALAWHIMLVSRSIAAGGD